MTLRNLLYKVLLLVLFLFCVSIFYSCNGNPEPNKKEKKEELFEYEEITPMSEELKTRVLTLCYEKYVRDDFPEQTVADLKIDYDMGNRNGNYVFIFSDGREYNDDPKKTETEIVRTYIQTFMSQSFEIHISYHHKNERPMRVYNNGIVYGFTEAFEKGIISEGDMEYFLQCHYFVTEGIKMQKRMDRNIENNIMECYLEGSDKEYYCCKYFTIIKYYLGSFHGCTVIGVSQGIVSDIPYLRNTEIDGITILQDESYSLKVYHDDHLYMLEEAYQIGLIVKDDLLLIAEKANSKELPIYNSSFLN